MLSIVHQKDDGVDSWHLVGIKKNKNLSQDGFVWMKGPHGGSWITFSRKVIEPFLNSDLVNIIEK